MSFIIETANGIVSVDVFKVYSISAFEHTACDLKVQVYDFNFHGILSDYDGVLGLDFFENTKFCIDMINQTIEVNSFEEKVNAPNYNIIASLQTIMNDIFICC